MKNSMLYVLWGGLFVLCAGLGFIPNPGLAGGMLMTALSILFFVPPGVLVYQASRRGDKETLKLVRNLSLLSLIMTALALVANLLGAVYSETLGNILHAFLIVVSSPMICSGYWVLSLFLWACLLMVTGKQIKKR